MSCELRLGKPSRIRLGVHHPKLIMAIELVEANIEDPLPQVQLAQYYLELRLERARHLLYQSDLPIMNIACACGFVSASHFSTCYRQMFGKTPRAERSEAARGDWTWRMRPELTAADTRNSWNDDGRRAPLARQLAARRNRSRGCAH